MTNSFLWKRIGGIFFPLVGPPLDREHVLSPTFSLADPQNFEPPPPGGSDSLKFFLNRLDG